MTSGGTKHDSHPFERFTAPSTIERGVPLSRLLGRQAVELLAESMLPVVPTFDSSRFIRSSMRGLLKLGLMERAAHVAHALARELPADFEESARMLVASFGPELTATKGVGLAPFFYLPHSMFIALYGTGSLETGMWACYELTKRFTAEFCIRPFLVEHQNESLNCLEKWTTDPNPHVRRLVSEGTRPRLPWGMRLKAFQADPLPTIALLERLKGDPVPFVYRSVANHLGDILKDNPAIGYATCERWIKEGMSPLDRKQEGPQLWVVRHALRFPAKKGDSRAVDLRRLAKQLD
jgi:3-methyladenine DNA glycosylase AlkC